MNIKRVYNLAVTMKIFDLVGAYVVWVVSMEIVRWLKIHSNTITIVIIPSIHMIKEVVIQHIKVSLGWLSNKERMILIIIYVYSDGIITRGCTADLTDEEYSKCNDDVSCTLCTDDNCNNEEISTSIKISANLILYLLVILIISIQKIYWL